MITAIANEVLAPNMTFAELASEGQIQRTAQALEANGMRTYIVVGAQKIVRDLDEGMRRINEYAYPLEDVRARQVYGKPSRINKVLLINGEGKPDRVSVILVRENLGF